MLKEVSHEISYGNTNSVKSIQYVNKGSNVVMSGWQQGNSRDEVTQYQMDRYNSSNETFWRIFGFPLYERQSAIDQLVVHLQNVQCVVFTESNAVQVAYTHSFLQLFKNITFNLIHFYSQMSSYYVWNGKKEWVLTLVGLNILEYPGFKSDEFLRLCNLHASRIDCVYLRLLLQEFRGQTSFQDVKNVNDLQRSQSLLEDNTQWDLTMADALVSKSSGNLTSLFEILLEIC